jgi:hypothetical protein
VAYKIQNLKFQIAIFPGGISFSDPEFENFSSLFVPKRIFLHYKENSR